MHQNHDYSYHPAGADEVWHGEEAQQNYQLHQGKFATVAYATDVLRYGRMKRNRHAWLGPVKRNAAARLSWIWFGLLNATRSVRRRLGVRSRGVRR